MIIYITLAYGLIVTAGAVAVHILKCREVKLARLDAAAWKRLADCFGSMIGPNAKESAQYLTRAKKAEARADHYASSWGRVMRKLRLAEQANKDMRTELMRRQNEDRIAA